MPRTIFVLSLYLSSQNDRYITIKQQELTAENSRFVISHQEIRRLILVSDENCFLNQWKLKVNQNMHYYHG